MKINVILNLFQDLMQQGILKNLNLKVILIMKKTIALSLTCFLALLFSSQTVAQNKLLGKIEFPNSGAPEAQADFMEGVLFLHNFEYEDAARAFRRAQEKDPDFALAYYGEAKTYNHPVWQQQDGEAAMDVLNELDQTPEARQAKAETQREKDYLHTLEVLYGNTPESEGKSKEERDDLYRQAMQQLHEKYPGDDEVTVFYGLSILGSAHEGRDFGTYMQAAAVLMDVWNKNKKHPGAAHYLIHSFDDPVHAPLGLPMAKAYADIAPAAAHAQHMTSHIFLALGMWDGVIDANIIARDVQTNRQQELNEQTTVCGHYPWWLQYGYLQAGNVGEAKQVLKKCYERVKRSPTSSEKWHFSVMKAHQVVDTQNWKKINTWTSNYQPDTNGSRNYFFTIGYAAIKNGNTERAEEFLNKLEQTEQSSERDIQIKQLEGLLQVEKGNTEKGIEILRKAVAAEFELPIDFGPPTIVKPSAELLADVYMALGNQKLAKEYYQKQLERTPKRRLTQLGLKDVNNFAER